MTAGQLDRVREHGGVEASPFGQALQQHRAGRLGEAETLCEALLAADPDHVDARHLLGLIALQRGVPERALTLIGQAIERNPSAASYHSNFATALKAVGRVAEAIVSYRHALSLRPDFTDARNNLGNALRQAGRLAEAAACYRLVLDTQPDNASACSNLGTILEQQGQLDEAIVWLRKAVQLNPNLQRAHYNLGTALRKTSELDESIAHLRRATELDPADRDAFYNLGNTLRERGLLNEAVSSLRKAVCMQPDQPDAHNNLSMALLANGDLAAGWAEYEWRWQTEQMAAGRRGFPQPLWRGEAGEGRRLLIHAEQGFGDTLQFCRYGPLAAARGWRVIMEVPLPLVRLIRTLPGIERVVPAGEALPDFDLQCPMLSLPRAVGTTLPSIPAAAAYLRPDPVQAAFWRNQLAVAGGGSLRVGLVWAGNPRSHMVAATAIDARRSLPPERLAALLDVPGVRFFSLQKDGPKAPKAFGLTDVMSRMTDFADTAALVVDLDLVIAVDTSVAHLAAALGRPVWLLDRYDPCWRWLAGRSDSPWYPTLRLYRQKRHGDWDAVVTEVREDLLRFASAVLAPARQATR